MENVDWGDGFTRQAKPFLVSMVVALLAGNALALVAHDDGSSASADPSIVTAPASDLSPGDQMQGAAGAGEGGAGDPGDADQGSPRSTTTSTAGPGGEAQAVVTTITTTTTTTPLPTPTSMKPTYSYKVTLEPTCARVGEQFTVTVHVEAWSAVGIIASHADGETYDTIYGKTAGADGLVVHRWLAPDVPGKGSVLTGATTPDGRTGGTPVDFRIVEEDETC